MSLLPDPARDFNVTPLAPIHPRYLRDQAFLSLREAIVSGRLAPGDPLVIDSLAETFGLSSMPVREAVKRLVADGLVEELPRRAHRIAPLTRKTALDVLGVMEVLMVGAYEVGVPQLRRRRCRCDARGARPRGDARRRRRPDRGAGRHQRDARDRLRRDRQPRARARALDDRPALRPRALPLVHRVDRGRRDLLPARSRLRARAGRAGRGDRDHAPRVAPLPRGRRRARPREPA